MGQTQRRPFGKYQLLDRLAAGGMAEIYRARYQALAGVTKPVVIKKILPGFATNPSFVSMFINEAKIAAGLSHGNIAQVFDFGEIDGELYIAMELVHGQAVSKVMRRARQLEIPVLPTPYALLIAGEMCKGLHYAHTRRDERQRPLGIIHRDVSPQNVLVSYEGQVKVVDFGIAKARNAGRTETEAGAVKGKYLYFSPEQARGQPLDARTDVYATGIVLYEMLCGRLPFEGKLVQVLSRIVKGEFPHPRVINPELSPELEEIILRAMALNREDRFPSAQAFGEALTATLYGFAPTFSNSALQALMTFLFEEELEAEGLSVRHSRALLEQVALWRKPLGEGEGARMAPVSEKLTTAERASRRRPSSTSGTAQPQTRGQTRPRVQTRSPGRRSTDARAPARPNLPRSNPPRSNPSTSKPTVNLPRRRPPLWLLIALPAAAMLFAATAVIVFSRPDTFSVRLGSEPPGAAVWVDGRPLPQPTPTTITGLRVDVPHHLELRALGHAAWRRTVREHESTVEVIDAHLPPLPALAPPPVKARAPVAPTPPAPVAAESPTPVFTPETDLPNRANYPVNRILLAPREHGFDVSQTSAPHLSLNPHHRYRIWATGRISLGGFLDNMFLDKAIWLAKGDAHLSGNDRFGEVGRHAFYLRNATELWGFIFDEHPVDNSGALQIHVEDLHTKQRRILLVDGSAHSLAPQGFYLEGLNVAARYRVRILEGDPPAHTAAGEKGEVRKVAFWQNAGWKIVAGKKTINSSTGVLEVGKSYTFTQTRWIRFCFPDDDLSDDSGRLKVEIVPIAGVGGGYFGAFK